MKCQNCNKKINIKYKKDIKIKFCTYCGATWIEHKDMNRIVANVVTKNITLQRPKRMQTPALSPTSEISYTESGYDYETYYSYKDYGRYEAPENTQRELKIY